MSLVYGPTDPPLWEKTLAELINEQAEKYEEKKAVVIPWQNASLTYRDLANRGVEVARDILALGLRPGDCIGILAGNCQEYIEVVMGAGYAGCPLVVLNINYTPKELASAVERTTCKLLFISSELKDNTMDGHITAVLTSTVDGLQVVTLGNQTVQEGSRLQSFKAFTSTSRPTPQEQSNVARICAEIKPDDLLNLQFTSGTTGAPKAAMLSHRNILNNARFVGHHLALTPSDTICSPPPLFHCFGLVMGLLSTLAHGATLVLPSATFSAPATLAALAQHRCSVLLGVPTMFLAALAALAAAAPPPPPLRTALAAGSPVPVPLVRRLRDELRVGKVLVAYGMTETSPVSFMTSAREEGGGEVGSLGRVMPHTGAKVVDARGRVVPRGTRGEMCTSGYALMRGYLGNGVATAEVMRADGEGVVWMHTGDECVIDERGLCWITGRIKDIIIRGGENIFPAEIEERLVTHPLVSEASVVGIRDEKYGETVGCFLRLAKQGERPTDEEVQEWVRASLGRHKAPRWVFWIGDAEVGDDYPKTGSGKHQKHILRALGNKLTKEKSLKARL
ncbi:uncharacterized protein LTHEOB_1195 [Neofusicoccum parvum]|uniref:Uncharacterized protein LTHEOB_1195 n=1 Tax=Neofusicoccum parvum TaxID=310453 RepID=A0ACB5SL27_9PEZI|nr:uncharacterized protein LTHEOB_1195 [Neofusicoccum parvum]